LQVGLGLLLCLRGARQGGGEQEQGGKTLEHRGFFQDGAQGFEDAGPIKMPADAGIAGSLEAYTFLAAAVCALAT
jgi:hypothetical protein